MKSHALVVAFVVGCAGTHVDRPVSTTTTTSGIINGPGDLAPGQGLRESPPIVVVGDDAAARIASVRCSHEEACGNIGDQRLFPSFDVCIVETRNASRQQLLGEVCPKGVDPYAMQQCIDDFRLQAACGETPESCSGSHLCRD